MDTPFEELFTKPEVIAACLGFLASFIGECLPQFQDGVEALKPAQKRMVMIIASFVAGFVAVFMNHLLVAPDEPLTLNVWYSLSMGVLAVLANYGTHLVFNDPGGIKGVVKRTDRNRVME